MAQADAFPCSVVSLGDNEFLIFLALQVGQPGNDNLPDE